MKYVEWHPWSDTARSSARMPCAALPARAYSARMACIAVPDAHQKGDPRYVIADATLDTLALVTDELLDRLDRSRGFA